MQIRIDYLFFLTLAEITKIKSPPQNQSKTKKKKNLEKRWKKNTVENGHKKERWLDRSLDGSAQLAYA